MPLRYSLKRSLRWFAYSAQSARWLTQEPVLRSLWSGKVVPQSRCLDVGCGGGSYAIEFFLKAGAQATLIEYDQALFQLAQKQVSETGYASSAKIQQGNAESLELPENTFDAIQCIEVLEHLQNPAAALRGMRAAARSGAWLVTSVPHPPEWVPNHDHVKAGYTHEEFTQLIEVNGWQVVEVRYCMLLITRIFAWLMSKGIKPHGVTIFHLLENLIPHSLRLRFLPYDIVVLAKAV